jgi:NDP-sugar pyrophosphorylase family protein
MADDTYWIDTGTPATYMAAQFDILAGRRSLVVIPEHHDLVLGVHLCDGAQVEGSAVAPMLIGGGAMVESGAIVSGSILGAGVRVESGAVVTNAVILDRATVRAGASVSDSVVGSDAVIGMRSILEAITIVGCGTEIDSDVHLVGARVPE